MKKALLLPALVLALAACSGVGPEPVDDGLRVAEVVLATPDGEVLAYSHDDHWHGTVRATVGRGTTLHAWVVSADVGDVGHDVPPREAWQRLSTHEGHTLRVISDNEAVASWTVSGDVLTLTSSQAGAALTTVVVLRGTTTRYQSPPAATISSPPSQAAR